MANLLNDNYLFLGPVLKARLAEQVPGVPVDVCETIQQVLEADRRARVLMVLWGGERFGGFAAANTVAQRWLVILGLNDVGAQADARQLKAGPLLSQVHRALAGWTPAGVHRPFARTSAGLAPSFDGNKALYPLGFEINLSI